MQATQAAIIQLEAMAGLAALARRRKSLQVFRGVEHLRNDDGFFEFARTQLRVIDKDTGASLPFKLNWVQRQVVETEMRMRREGRKPNILVLKFRQGGVSTVQQGMAFWEIWRRENAFCRTFAHRDKDTRVIFGMVTRFYKEQPERHRHGKTAANTMWLQYPEWGSEYWAETAVASAGRGSRARRLHLSEAAYYPDLEGLVGSLEDAQFHDAAFVWETTANGKKGRGQAFYETWQAAKRGENDFYPLFFAWHVNPDHVKPLLDPDYPRVAPAEWWKHTVPDELGELDPEELERAVRFNLSPQQINWWREKRRRLQLKKGNPWLILQEHPDDEDSCFLEGGDPFYERGSVKSARSFTRDPMEPAKVKEWIDTLTHLSEDDRADLRRDAEFGRLRLFGLPVEGSRTAIGADVGGGVSQDGHAAVGVDFKTGEQLFSYETNVGLPDKFGNKLWVLGWAFKVPGQELPAYVGVEQQNHGHAALAALMSWRQYPTECIYHHIVQTQADAQPAKRAGWNHNEKGHEELTVAVGQLLSDGRPRIRDDKVIQSIQEVSLRGKGGAEFTGRDLAVAAGIATIVIPFARPEESWTYMGGMLVNLSTGETRSPDQPASTEPDDDGGDGAFQWAIG